MGIIARLVTVSAVVLGPFLFFSPAQAVEYVKVCDAAGPGYFTIPGSYSASNTYVCINPDTGETKTFDDDNNLIGSGESQLSAKSAEDSAKAFEGAAMSMAMPAPFIESGKNFAIGGNIAAFGGQSALGFTAAARVNDGLSLNGGIGFGLGEHTIGGRAGFNFSW
jgi:hypothetical protein